MGDLSFWKILRVLTTNSCNYKCSFCHNEGQEKEQEKKQFLKFLDYKIIIDSLNTTQLKEVHFSGGEPFMNSETIKMILYTNDNTNFEIGCATNTSLLTEETIVKLSNTRIKLNIQFPAIEHKNFKRITGRGNINLVRNKLELLKKYNIEFGLNHVMQFGQIESIIPILDFVKEHKIPLKLLPDLSNLNNRFIKDSIFPFLDSISINKIDKGTGAIKWWIIGSDSSEVPIIYIDSPCFYQDVISCKNYAEIRLFPDLKLQTCIKKGELSEFDFEIVEENKVLIVNKFEESWNNFISC